MARKDTFLKTSLSNKSIEKPLVQDNVKSVKDAVSPIENVKENNKKIIEQKEKEVESSNKSNENQNGKIEVNVNALFKKQKTLGTRTTKTVRVYEELNAILEKLTRDPKTNKTLPSSHGFISKIVNNGIIKELVELGVIDKSYLEYIEDYY